MAGKDPVEDPSLWTVSLEKVERVIGADPADQVDDLFCVAFDAEGPNLTAHVEVMVVDLADESRIIAEAMDATQDGLEQWAAVLGKRPGAEPGV